MGRPHSLKSLQSTTSAGRLEGLVPEALRYASSAMPKRLCASARERSLQRTRLRYSAST